MNDIQNTQQLSVVSRCDAVSCRYNEEHECRAGQIEVSISGQMAQCLTYSPEDSASTTDQPGQGIH